eukprot:scaffold175922_cov27-Tisochrysis_lutea.AAC.3
MKAVEAPPTLAIFRAAIGFESIPPTAVEAAWATSAVAPIVDEAHPSASNSSRVEPAAAAAAARRWTAATEPRPAMLSRRPSPASCLHEGWFILKLRYAFSILPSHERRSAIPSTGAPYRREAADVPNPFDVNREGLDEVQDLLSALRQGEAKQKGRGDAAKNLL